MYRLLKSGCQYFGSEETRSSHSRNVALIIFSNLNSIIGRAIVSLAGNVLEFSYRHPGLDLSRSVVQMSHDIEATMEARTKIAPIHIQLSRFSSPNTWLEKCLIQRFLEERHSYVTLPAVIRNVSLKVKVLFAEVDCHTREPLYLRLTSIHTVQRILTAAC